jgi:hypothetical protein
VGHGRVPGDGEVKEEAVAVDQRLDVLEHATSVREGEHTES